MTSPLIEPHLYERPRSMRRAFVVRGLGGWLALLPRRGRMHGDQPTAVHD